MSGLIESALAIMGGAERRIAIAASNVANANTPGFKRQVSFAEAMVTAGGGRAETSPTAVRTRSDFSQGQMAASGNGLDVAIGGDGFFQLRAGEEIAYSRQGQFHRADDGRVLSAQGHVLQQAGGGDLVLDGGEVEILADGTVIEGERPVARIAVFAAADPGRIEALGGSLFRIAEDAAEELAEPDLRQHMVEASNVTLGEEMTGMMAALRQAESGARLVSVYDDLLGRAITTFGQTGR
ncbi:MAG TPA: flagellar hook basal-body protein [Allosphingosinicella sp.]|jgi:flagellar basal-body rod protein FlgG